MTIEKLDLKTPDFVRENITKIAELFPNCVTESAEGKVIDFDLLRQELSHNVVEGAKERYQLNWPGKREAIVAANLPTTKTLRPVREDSVDFDNTENIYIEGDNLEVLKLLQESYLNRVKIIYIDPPYNTGKDFVYKDNFTTDREKWAEMSEQRDEYNRRLEVNPDTAGRYHSNWLSMMYPRLKLARNLLTDDGVIFISIDDNEVHNLRKLCDEIFGEGNFVAQINWKGRGGRQDSKHYAVIHEYILCYSRDLSEFVAGEEVKEKDTFPKFDEFKNRNYKTQLARKWGSNSKRSDRPNLYYSIIAPDGDEVFPMLSETEDGCWRWGRARMDEEINQGNIEFVKKEKGWIAYEKIYEPLEGEEPTKKYTTWIDSISTGTGSDVIKTLFRGKIFDYPKPTDLIKTFILMANVVKDSIILDFFSGSGTTAHAVMALNAEDGGRRKYINVQIPEDTDEKSEAHKAGYKNICQIGKERIRRAGKKIKEETGADIDYGFRVYQVDESNMQDVHYKPQEYTQNLLDQMTDNIKAGRTADDLLTQVMLDLGLPLSLKIEQIEVAGKQVLKVADNSLLACFDDNIDVEFAKAIAPHIPRRMVFRDSSFHDDTAKINVQQLLKQLSPKTEMKVF
ncbi:MAG: site-specific DNA-methyltransferase [Bacteroidales bacterium]